MPAIVAAVPLYVYGGIAFTTLSAYIAYLYSQGINLNPFVKGDDYDPKNLVSLEELGINVEPKQDPNKWAGSFYQKSDTIVDESIRDLELGKFDYTKSSTMPKINTSNTVPTKTHVKAVKLMKTKEYEMATADQKIMIQKFVTHKNEKLAHQIIQKTPDRFVQVKEGKYVQVKNSAPVSINQLSLPEMKNNKHYDIKQGNIPVIKAGEPVFLNQKDLVNPQIKTFKSIDGATNKYSKSGLSNKVNVEQYASASKGSLSQKVNVEQYASASKGALSNKRGNIAEVTSPHPNGQTPNGAVGFTSSVGDTNDAVVSSPTIAEIQRAEEFSDTSNAVTNKVKHRPPGENVLYNLEPYTYEFTLSALPSDLYNEADFETASNRNIIIKSSGLGKNKSDLVAGAEYPTLAPGSQLNKHFGTVTLKSIIGLNSKTSVSNIHGLDFQVFEPFGSSLLDDLHDGAISVGFNNYLKCPYLLTLRFKGMDDEGRPVSNLVGTYGHVTRYFPIKIINCDFNVSGGGTTYNFTGVPFNANTMTDNVKYTQTPVNIRGATVGEFMQDFEDQLNAQNSIVEHNAKYPSMKRKFELYCDDTINQNESKRLTEATINHDYMTAQSTSYANELTEEGKKKVETLGSSPIENVTADDLIKVHGITDFTRRVYTFNAGTSILSIIEAIVDSSDYITRQLEGEEVFTAGINSDGQVPWYNIDYKHLTSSRSKLVDEMWVFKLFAHYVDHNTVLAVSNPAWVNTKAVARKYDYIYTGENRDILNFDIQYNFAFFQAMAANRDTTKGDTSDKAVKSSENQNMITSEPLIDAADGGLVPIESQATDTTMQDDTQGTEDANITGRKKISNAKKALTNPEADLINLEIEILGDPYYLQQADFNPFNLKPSVVNASTFEDGSIDTQSGEVYVNVNFKTPVDFDDESGLYKGLNQGPGKYNTAFFGGIYRLIQVESTFDGGQFTQRLNGVRLKNQQLDQPKSKETTGEKEPSTKLVEDTSAGETEYTFDAQQSRGQVTQGIDVKATNESGEIVMSDQAKVDSLLHSQSGYNKASSTQESDLAEFGGFSSILADPTSFIAADQAKKSKQNVKTDKVGNTTTTTTTTTAGTTTTISESQSTVSGGEATVVDSVDYTIGPKYDGLTERQYYQGIYKKEESEEVAPGVFAATGEYEYVQSDYVAIRRRRQAIANQCKIDGCTKEEKNAKIKAMKVNSGLYDNPQMLDDGTETDFKQNKNFNKENVLDTSKVESDIADGYGSHYMASGTD